MSRHPQWRFIFCVAFLLCLSKVALAQVGSGAAQAAPSAERAADISIPSDVGYVLEQHRPSVAISTAAHVIHIQEAHTNYEGQRHIAAILQQLIQTHQLKLVMVEAGEGDVSLSYLRDYSTPESRQRVAENYLKSGLISGEEYLDLTSDRPLMLWGVERMPLYEDNVQAFLEVKEIQAQLTSALVAVQGAVKQLEPLLADPALSEVRQQAAIFERDASNILPYAEALVRAAPRAKVAIGSDHMISRFVRSSELERAIDRQAIPREQTALLKELSAYLPQADIEALIDQAYAMKAGTVRREQFYGALNAAARRAGVALAPYANLSRYMQYVEDIAQVNPVALAEEFRRVTQQVVAGLAVSPESRELAQLVEQADLVAKMVQLKLSPDEYNRAQALPVEQFSATWPAAINRLLQAHGLPAQPFAGLESLEAAAPTLRRFYESARARDEALVEATLAKLRETREPVAVLITGGFHGPEIAKRLGEAGLQVTVVVPRISGPTDDRLYEAVLKYKHGSGNLDDIITLQSQEAGQ